MTTRSELFGKPARSTLPGLLWDIALGLGAVVYVLFALFDGLYSPFMTLVVAAVVGYGLIRPHRRRPSEKPPRFSGFPTRPEA